MSTTGAVCKNPTQRQGGYFACWAHVTEEEAREASAAAGLREELAQLGETNRVLQQLLTDERAALREARAQVRIVEDLKAQLARVAAHGAPDCNLRRTSQSEEFPYYSDRVSWIAVWPDRRITNPSYAESRNEALDALAERRLSALLIAWPGQWTTDTFIVDEEAWPVVQRRAALRVPA